MGQNSDIDFRHTATSAVQAPDEACDVNCVRCEACQRVVTEWEVAVYGMCPRCRNNRFRGMSHAHGLAALRLAYWNVTKAWQVHGPAQDSKGFERAKKAWRKKLSDEVEDTSVVTPL